MKSFLSLFICTTILSFARSQDENTLITTLTLQGDTLNGYYYATLFFGTPLQRQTLIVDTGSTLTAIPCSECGANCGTSHFDPFFNESSSETFRYFDCNLPFGQYTCLDCLNQCPFHRDYQEGSSYDGHYIQDFISFGDGFEKVFAPFGCITQEAGLVYYQNVDGILGLGVLTNTIYSPPNFLDVLEMNNQNNSKAFTLCLAQEGGYFSIGGYNSTTHYPNEPVFYTNFADSQYQLTLNNISVNGEDLGLNMNVMNEGGIMLDSGSAFSSFYFEAYDAMLSSFDYFCNEDESPCVRIVYEDTLGNPNCWIPNPEFVPSKEDFFSAFPTFSFYFYGDAEYQWEAQDYLYRAQGPDEIYCLGMSNATSATILGATFMKNHDIMFDKENSMIGFIRASCSTSQF